MLKMGLVMTILSNQTDTLTMFIQTCSVYRLELDMKQHIKWVRLLLYTGFGTVRRIHCNGINV